MSKQLITEGLDYLDLEGQMIPKVTVDEYAAKMGENSEIVTLSFIVKNKQAGEDLCDWFERGYDFVLDSQVSDGEISPGKYFVFVEMDRRTTVPKRIIELLTDLKTLTGLKLNEWEIKVDDEIYEPEEQILSKVIMLSPHQYRVEVESEEELNEMREIAGMETKKIHNNYDSELKDFIMKAGL